MEERFRGKEIVMPEKYEMPYNMDLFVRLREKLVAAASVLDIEQGVARKYFNKGERIDFKEFRQLDSVGFEEWRKAVLRTSILSQMVRCGYIDGEELFRNLSNHFRGVSRVDIIDVLEDVIAEIDRDYQGRFDGKVKRESAVYPHYLGVVLRLQKNFSILVDEWAEYKDLVKKEGGNNDDVDTETIFGSSEDAIMAPYRLVAMSVILGDVAGSVNRDKMKEVLTQELSGPIEVKRIS